MKKLLLVVLVCLGAWQLYEKKNTPVITNADLALLEALDKSKNFSEPVSFNNNYSCDGRQYCSQMNSCEEATFFIQHCPNTKMDGNNDGIPCERQWCN